MLRKISRAFLAPRVGMDWLERRVFSMDHLHTGLAALQQRLSFVATEPINWKFYVQTFSWTVTLFESYLLCVFSSNVTEYHPE